MTLSQTESFGSNFEKPKVLIVFQKKSFKFFTISLSFIRIFWFATMVIFSLLTDLIESTGFTAFQKPLLSVTFFHSGFYKSSFLFFLVAIHKDFVALYHSLTHWSNIFIYLSFPIRNTFNFKKFVSQSLFLHDFFT